MLPATPLLRLTLSAAAALLAGSLWAAPLAPEEARSALRRAQTAPAPGSYRSQSSRATKGGTVTTTTLTLRPPSGPPLTRTETVTIPKDQPSRPRTRVVITNEEGIWQLYSRKALLVPAPFNFNAIMDAVNRASASGSADEPTTGPEDPISARARALAPHIQVTGEDIGEGAARRLHITRTFGPEMVRFLEEVIDEKVTAMKKELPFGKRMLVSTALAVKGGVGSMIPARQVYVIDPAENRIETTENYGRDGKLLNRATPRLPEKIADLPAETFAIPAGLEIVRARTLGEAWELGEKIEAEEKSATEAADL